MSPEKRQAREALRAETARAVAELERRGTCWQQWARDRGFSPAAVKDVCRDRNPATRGEAWRVAFAIRQEAAAGLALYPFPANGGQAMPKPERLQAEIDTLEGLVDFARKFALWSESLDVDACDCATIRELEGWGRRAHELVAPLESRSRNKES